MTSPPPVGMPAGRGHGRARRAAMTGLSNDGQMAHYAKLGLTVDIIDGFRKQFELFDKDGSGTVSVDELEAVFSKIGHAVDQDELLALFEEVDSDGSGDIDFNEFLTLMIKRLESQPLSEVDIVEAFRVFDRDANNSISVEELTSVIANIIGEDVDPDIVEMMFEEADEAGKGTVSYEDFVRILEWEEPNLPLKELLAAQHQAAMEQYNFVQQDHVTSPNKLNLKTPANTPATKGAGGYGGDHLGDGKTDFPEAIPS